jgi:hypothetical protein
MRGPRSDKVNEKYYAQRDHPNFRQFGNKYHFTDEQGRQYRVAERNNDTFQNANFQSHTNEDEKQLSECVIDQYGDVKLYVKLPTPQHQWYTHNEIGSALALWPRKKKDGVIPVSLRTAFKEEERVGVITVEGLSEDYCNTLLNK